jgi:nicotinamide-nucleotide amidase
MSFSVSVLATGSELLDGRVVDTNSNFVARELSELGLKLRRVLTVDDDMNELVGGLSRLSEVSSIIITSGGLGPTSDDLTRDAVASFAGVGLFECPVALKHVEEFFAKRGRALDETNRRQAVMPVGSRIITNERGSAPGFITQGENGAIVCSLSGVPREFQQMFRSSVLPLIKQQCGDVPLIHRATFKLLGVPESSLAKVIEALKLPEDVVVSYRAASPEVHLVLKSARADLAEFADQARAALGRGNAYTEDPEILFVGALQSALELKQLTIATAESCSGGMAAELLTRTPGSSRVFRGSVVAYHNDIKEQQLGVLASTLAQHGAVSAETVREMAQGVRDLLKSDIGVAISGVAGPDGGSDAKPVGTFFVGVLSPHGSFEQRCLYSNERQNVRVYASYVALDLVRRHVLGLPLPAGYPIWLAA